MNMGEKIELDIVIVPEGEGESRVYSISSVQVPNVVTQGNTLEEAKARLKEALELYFEEVPEEKAKELEEEKKTKPPEEKTEEKTEEKSEEKPKE